MSDERTDVVGEHWLRVFFLLVLMTLSCVQSLPLPFCKDNLPDHDEWVTLVDEDGGEWQTKYLAAKNGLSGGWRGFAIDHELVDGDCLIFQLVKPNTLKVRITL